jgi:hypothetical protein
MRTLEAPSTMPLEKKSGIRWKRVVLAAVFSELVVFGVLAIVIVVYRFILAPGLTAAHYNEFAANIAGYYFAAPAAAVGTLIFAVWAARGMKASPVKAGLLVGITAAVLSLPFIFGAEPEHRLMYTISYAARIAGGYWGGFIARRMKGHVG